MRVDDISDLTHQDRAGLTTTNRRERPGTSSVAVQFVNKRYAIVICPFVKMATLQETTLLLAHDLDFINDMDEEFLLLIEANTKRGYSVLEVRNV